ncbi:hypothetical protein D3C75_1110550 [compost metagenome]
MAADIAQNAAEVAPIVEPRRATLAFAVWAGTQRLHHFANGPLLHQLSGKHRALNVQAFAVIDRVFFAGFRHHGFGIRQLFQAGERGFVGEIVLTGSH